MPTLLIRLTGPLQSWGSQSRFSTRSTENAPTKSGVFGLIAAAQGRRRSDSITDLLELSFGVRIDQPGRLVRDFQTAKSRDGSVSMPLSYRYYLCDATFLAGVYSEDAELLAGIQGALRAPGYPLYLGRRSCPPAGPLFTEIVDGTAREALARAPWQAAAHHQRANAAAHVSLRILSDSTDADADDAAERIHDEPVSFDSDRREYNWRRVVSTVVTVPNPQFVAKPGTPDDHDPMLVLTEGF
ncbi:CRISPR-associated Cas5e family protein [Leucobacter luti]|uniref:CRISPR-associated Cas5e family protein n=1 Tax=Leucobacter luti TaxID=340320 RepID=A0A4V3CY29_9MICO|nr:type I-E CRISPR-associated protein Cas5/CasD [Leucobacter luti]TDP92578.1 CRISPR-associated Cas5e family protein [Leucobacter luti]